MNAPPEESTAARADPAGVLAALTHIDGVGFHGIATNLTGPAPVIDRNWPGLTRNALIAVRVTAWPDGMHPAVERFASAAEPLADALTRRDVVAAAGAAQELHAAYHALSDAGWGYLGRIAGLPGSADAHVHAGARRDHGH